MNTGQNSILKIARGEEGQDSPTASRSQVATAPHLGVICKPWGRDMGPLENTPARQGESALLMTPIVIL